MTVVSMEELENRIVKNTIATMKQGCYQCVNFDKIERPSPLCCFINFKDKSRIILCSIHFLQFKQKRK